MWLKLSGRSAWVASQVVIVSRVDVAAVAVHSQLS